MLTQLTAAAALLICASLHPEPLGSTPVEPGLENRDDIIFTCNFDSPEWFREWGMTKPPQNAELVSEDPERKFEPLAGRALRVTTPKGQHYGTTFWFAFKQHIGEEPEEVYFRYYLRLGDDWNPPSSGKLPGFGGTYWRGGWGGRPSDGKNGWSARGLFNGRAEGKTPTGFYCYHADMDGQYGSNWGWETDKLGYLENNRWVCIEQYVKLNTPGQKDGVLRGWVDGALAFEKTDIRMRDVDNLKVQQVWMDFYHGGSWTPEADDHVYVDNVVIARNPIGPMQKAERFWVGPMPFTEGRTLRDDYFPTLGDATKWPSVLSRAGVFKSYIMVLPDGPIPGKTAPELTDDQMRALIALLRERGLRTAFEVGGIRAPDEMPNSDLGETTAVSELTHLQRWLKLGGSIDLLTTDHAVMHTIGSPYIQPEQLKSRGMSLAEVVEEHVDYFAAVSKAIPGVRLGAIESLGFFEVDGPDGKHYSRTVPALPQWPFETYLDTLLAAMKRRGLTLDHFHVDFGYEGVHFDGGGQGKLDFGRILGVEAACHARGVKVGIICNAFHDQSVKDPQPATASREARERTLEFLRGYLAAGGKADHLVLQTWMPYPDRTGPEADPDTVLGIAREGLDIIEANDGRGH